MFSHGLTNTGGKLIRWYIEMAICSRGLGSNHGLPLVGPSRETRFLFELRFRASTREFGHP